MHAFAPRAIQDVSKHLGLPLSFKHDVEIDIAAVSSPGAPDTFLWSVYDLGTHIIFPCHPEASRMAHAVLKNFPTVRTYVFERGSLIAVSHNKWIAIACDYERANVQANGNAR